MIVWDKLKIANITAPAGIVIEPVSTNTLQISGNISIPDKQIEVSSAADTVTLAGNQLLFRSGNQRASFNRNMISFTGSDTTINISPASGILINDTKLTSTQLQTQDIQATNITITSAANIQGNATITGTATIGTATITSAQIQNLEVTRQFNAIYPQYQTTIRYDTLQNDAETVKERDKGTASLFTSCIGKILMICIDMGRVNLSDYVRFKMPDNTYIGGHISLVYYAVSPSKINGSGNNGYGAFRRLNTEYHDGGMRLISIDCDIETYTGSAEPDKNVSICIMLSNSLNSWPSNGDITE